MMMDSIRRLIERLFPSPTAHIADDAVAKLRAFGADDERIRERFDQAAMLEAAPVSAELLQVVCKIAATGQITRGDLVSRESAGVTVRVAAPEPKPSRGRAELVKLALEQAEIIDWYTPRGATVMRELALTIGSHVAIDEAALAEVLSHHSIRGWSNAEPREICYCGWGGDRLADHLAQVATASLLGGGR